MTFLATVLSKRKKGKAQKGMAPPQGYPRDHGQMESIRTRMLAILEAHESPPIARGRKGKGARRPTKKHPWGL